MQQNMRVIILGGTGAVGAEVCAALSRDQRVASVTLLVRRDIPNTYGPKFTTKIVDVLSPQSYQYLVSNHEVALCTFGVGQPSKVSKEEFQRIDYDAVLAFASACKQSGIQHFELLNSVAADPQSRSFYLKSKGHLREAISKLQFARFSCFQPSMLITNSNRYDALQGIMLVISPILSHLLLGPLRKYRSIHVAELGKAFAQNIFSRGAGVEILHWPEFKTLTSS